MSVFDAATYLIGNSDNVSIDTGIEMMKNEELYQVAVQTKKHFFVAPLYVSLGAEYVGFYCTAQALRRNLPYVVYSEPELNCLVDFLQIVPDVREMLLQRIYDCN